MITYIYFNILKIHLEIIKIWRIYRGWCKSNATNVLTPMKIIFDIFRIIIIILRFLHKIPVKSPYSKSLSDKRCHNYDSLSEKVIFQKIQKLTFFREISTNHSLFSQNGLESHLWGYFWSWSAIRILLIDDSNWCDTAQIS